MSRAIRVLVVDDSALVRQTLCEGLASDGIEVIGTAADPYEARDKIVRERPDVVTLDVEMPRMDGVEFLRRLMPQLPVPVVMVSALTKRSCEITLAALAAGAVDFVTKPSKDVKGGLASMMVELRTKVRIASCANVGHWKNRKPASSSNTHTGVSALAESTDKVIAIGASTGGTEATRVVLMGLPRTTPGIVVVQHMPATFTQLYAERLNEDCPHRCVEAKDGDRIIAGSVYVAPGDYHMEVHRSGGHYLLRCRKGAKVNGHTPSVDVMFHSVAKSLGRNAVGVLLTGMGKDGAAGLLAMRNAGARTVVQDEATSVVWGMPGEAWKMGAADEMGPIGELSARVLRNLQKVAA